MKGQERQISEMDFDFSGLLEKLEKEVSGRELLEIGCGEGARLALAADRGWNCFGIEASIAARNLAQERHGVKVFLSDSIEHLLPHRFDVILLLFSLEGIASPLQLFLDLFSKGAVGPSTVVAIAATNTRAAAMMSRGSVHTADVRGGWGQFSGESLKQMLERLHFDHIEISGLGRREAGPNRFHEDESSTLNARNFSGLLACARGSDFYEFIHERYLPGTWSKLAEYEHLPRYLLARTMASGGRVLDFGCGTGYGSALLAETADSVLAVDIDEPALEWARQTHRSSRLQFERRDDLGRDLPETSFDLITCFEMIEHVDEHTQSELIGNLKRLLRPHGKLIISTPNPEVTAHYGENPYHLREMNEEQFRELLGRFFNHVQILKQWVQSSVLIEGNLPSAIQRDNADKGASNAVGYVALCSQQSPGKTGTFLHLDSSFDFVFEALRRERAYNQAQFVSYQSFEKLRNRTREVATLTQELHRVNLALGETHSALVQAGQRAEVLATDLKELQSTKWWRLRSALKEPFSSRQCIRAAYLVAGMVTPLRLRLLARPAMARLRQKWIAAPKAFTEEALVIPPHRRVAEPIKVRKVSVVIPTKDAGPGFRTLLQRLLDQKLDSDFEIVVVDSGSRDATQAIAWQYGARVITIQPHDFNHGRTRNLGSATTDGDIVVFLTQDAMPGDELLVQHLTSCFSDPAVAGVYARQVPRADADPITRRRLTSWITGSLEPYARRIEDAHEYVNLTPWQRYQFCNFDNVCSAIRRSVLSELPFEEVAFGEDIEWGKRALEAGWKIVYQPKAWVLHSHRRSFVYEYKRNYQCHRQLKRLFGLRSVPSLPAAMSAVVNSVAEDWSYLWKMPARPWSLLARTPLMNLASILGQYRGAGHEPR